MQLDELKQNITLLDSLLERSSSEIRINEAASKTAQTKILHKYRNVSIQCFILAAVFTLLWIGGADPETFPPYINAFLIIYLAAGAAWYLFMYFRLKRIDISGITPAQLFTRTTEIKILAISGEVVFAVSGAVFLTMFFIHILQVNPVSFWLAMITVIIGVILSIFYYIPRYIKLFRALTTVRD